MPRDVFMTGGTGYIGRRLAQVLISAEAVRVLEVPDIRRASRQRTVSQEAMSV